MRYLTILALLLASCRPAPTPPVDPSAATPDACDRAGVVMGKHCAATPGPKSMTWAQACRKLSVPDELGVVLAPVPVDCIASAGSKAEVKACKVRCD